MEIIQSRSSAISVPIVNLPSSIEKYYKNHALSLHNQATKSIHSTFHVLLHLIPIGTPSDKFVYLFDTKNALESGSISYDCGHLLCMRRVYQIYLNKFSECVVVL